MLALILGLGFFLSDFMALLFRYFRIGLTQLIPKVIGLTNFFNVLCLLMVMELSVLLLNFFYYVKTTRAKNYWIRFSTRPGKMLFIDCPSNIEEQMKKFIFINMPRANICKGVIYFRRRTFDVEGGVL